MYGVTPAFITFLVLARLNRYNCITLIMKTGDSGSLKAGPEFWIFMGGGGVCLMFTPLLSGK